MEYELYAQRQRHLVLDSLEDYPVGDHSWENAWYAHAPDLVCKFHQHFPEKSQPTKFPVPQTALPEELVEKEVNQFFSTIPGEDGDWPSIPGLQLWAGEGRGGIL